MALHVLRAAGEQVRSARKGSVTDFCFMIFGRAYARLLLAIFLKACYCAKRMHITLTPLDTQTIFNNASERLTREGKSLPKELLHRCAERVMEGIDHLSCFTDWAKAVDGHFDVGNPVRAPYNVVMDRFGFPDAARSLKIETAVLCGFIPQEIEDRTEREALNACWNEVWEQLRKDQTTRA